MKSLVLQLLLAVFILSPVATFEYVVRTANIDLFTRLMLRFELSFLFSLWAMLNVFIAFGYLIMRKEIE